MASANENFLQLSAQTLRAIDETQERLSEMLRSDPPPNPGQKRRIKIERTELDGDWEKVYQQTLAVSQGTHSFTAPSDPDVAMAKQIADNLDAMTGQTNTMGAIVKAATDVMKIWNKTKVT